MLVAVLVEAQRLAAAAAEANQFVHSSHEFLVLAMVAVVDAEAHLVMVAVELLLLHQLVVDVEILHAAVAVAVHNLFVDWFLAFLDQALVVADVEVLHAAVDVVPAVAMV